MRFRAFALALVIGLGPVGCAAKKEPVDAAAVSAEQMYRRGIDLLSQRKLRQALAVMERIQYSTGERGEIEPLSRLAVADATFYQGTDLSLIDARSLYLDFVSLYGNHRLAPYAQTQVGYCSLKQVNHPSRDQSETHRAIDELRQVEGRWPDSPFAVAARKLLRQARANLAENEFLVGRFYMKRKSYAAAVERFRSAIDRYPGYEEREKILYHLGQALVLSHNDHEARLYLERLLSDYPKSDYARQARKNLEEVLGPDPG